MGVFLRVVGGGYGSRMKVWMWQEWSFFCLGLRSVLPEGPPDSLKTPLNER